MKRVLLDSVLFVGIVILLYFKFYTNLAAPLQLVLLKMLLVSAGILHAHIARKILFPKVNWNMEIRPNTIVAISFYIVIPLCYAFGG